MKQLRDYQIRCLEAIRDAVAEGKRRMLVRMPTGSGKTFTFAHLPLLLGSRRVMMVAHREELLTQATKHFQELGFTAEIEKAGSVASPDCQVVVASVQTLKNGRLAKFNPADFDLLIIDESHHCTDINSYQRLISHFSKAIVIGFTATPYRSDKKNLTDVFTDGVVFDLGMMDLIKKGYLTPIKIVNQEIFSKFAPEHVFNAYQRHVQGLKSIVFCRNIAHSLAMAEAFTSNGVLALSVYSGMPKEERKEALVKFAKGEVQVLSSVGVLTEGFDEPSIQSIVLARNTTSRSLYEQMLGRGVRLHENKDKLKVVQLIPVPPPQPIPVEKRLYKVWNIIKKLLLLGILICAVAWIWKTCNAVAEMSLPSGVKQLKYRQAQRQHLRVTTVCKLRSGPSTSSKTIGLINPTDQLTLLEQTKTQDRVWIKIQTKGKIGWCGCRLETK